MNLNTITEVKRPSSADQITQWRDNYAWLAGGTWLFSVSPDKWLSSASDGRIRIQHPHAPSRQRFGP
jgi:hypothetical protein